MCLHCGGINLFDRPALAVKEMLRVARPGARILIADETKQVHPVEHPDSTNQSAIMSSMVPSA